MLSRCHWMWCGTEELECFNFNHVNISPSCYFNQTLNSYNFTSLSMSAWIFFLSFCNIAFNLGHTISGLLQLSNCFSVLRFSWIITSMIITFCILLILASYGELFFGNLIQLLHVCGDIKINPGRKTKNQILFCHWNLNGFPAYNFTKGPYIYDIHQ